MAWMKRRYDGPGWEREKNFAWLMVFCRWIDGCYFSYVFLEIPFDVYFMLCRSTLLM